MQTFRIIILASLLAGWATFPTDTQEMALAFSLPWGERRDPGFPGFRGCYRPERGYFLSLSARYLKDPSWDRFIAEYNETEDLRPGQSIIIPLNPGEKGGLTLRGYQTVPVLSYHNLAVAESNKMTVSQAMFERQMGFLGEKGYHVISMDQLFDFLEFKAVIPPKSVAITIDDGWLSAYEIALPILKKYSATGQPCSSARIGSIRTPRTLPGTSFRKCPPLVSRFNAIRRATATYPSQERKNRSKNILKIWKWNYRDAAKPSGQRNREAKYLAYPYGETTPLVIETAKKLGYRGALTFKRGGNPFFIHNYRVNRSLIYGDFTMSQFEKNLTIFQEQAPR